MTTPWLTRASAVIRRAIRDGWPPERLDAEMARL